MGKCFVDPITLFAVAGLLAEIAADENFDAKPCKPKRKPCCGGNHLTQPRDEFGRFTRRSVRNECTRPTAQPIPRWGVCGEPKEDKNKVFGVNIRVDEPKRSDYSSRWAFERDHAKFDNLVDAAEACTWANKSNTAPLHKVNCIRRRIEDGPVFGLNLVGETEWF